MSRAELIAMIDHATPTDRIFLQAYLEHLARENDPAHGADLDRRLDTMRAGNEVSLEEARKMHDRLIASGM